MIFKCNKRNIPSELKIPQKLTLIVYNFQKLPSPSYPLGIQKLLVSKVSKRIKQETLFEFLTYDCM